MDFDRILKMMINDEGEKYQLYLDTENNATIGIGYNISSRGISQHISRMLFKECTQEVINDLSLIFIDHGFFTFPENIQMVLFNMRFQMGYRGFRRFKKMILAVQKQNYQKMIEEMKDSIWYHKYTARAKRLINLVQEVIDEKERNSRNT